VKRGPGQTELKWSQMLRL